ncbi:hypothetical protein A7U60_g7525 [Sanghuangporus baumii]|uniref:Uncharacterized protein n=1 Tax=Sanghuangporus baumii TaxID=108892 RepID=A0A9Q5N047_SANBA|nr:hypothetical protein A7U60_g7525 [Sanghuangporus baumii]
MGRAQAGEAVDMAAIAVTGANQEANDAERPANHKRILRHMVDLKGKEGLTRREVVTINLQDQEGDISRGVSGEVRSAHKGLDDRNRIAGYPIS